MGKKNKQKDVIVEVDAREDEDTLIEDEEQEEYEEEAQDEEEYEEEETEEDSEEEDSEESDEEETSENVSATAAVPAARVRKSKEVKVALRESLNPRIGGIDYEFIKNKEQKVPEHVFLTLKNTGLVSTYSYVR